MLRAIFPFRRIGSVPVSMSRDIIKSTSSDIDAPNTVNQRIKTAGDSQELLEIISVTRKQDIEAHQLKIAIDRLFQLQKHGYNTLSSRDLIKHSGFNSLEHLLKFKVSRMEVNDCVSCLKTFMYLGLENSATVHRLLHQIKEQINDLSPNNSVFLNFLLSKMKKTPLIEALQIAVPVVFNMNLSQKIDHENPRELTDLLFYATSTTMKVSRKSMMNIVSALTIHGNTLDLDVARSVIWSFTSMKDFQPGYEKLLGNCMAILNSNFMELSFGHLETTLSKMITKFLQGDYFIYNEDFFNNCAQYCTAHNVGYLNASYILKKFNRVNFVSYELLNYIDKTILENHSNLSSCKAAGLLTLSCGLSNACYKSDNWEIIKSIMYENPLMHNAKIELPWIKFAVEMMAIGFHSKILLEKIFSTEFLRQHLDRENNSLDYVRLLTLYQSVKLLVPDYTGPFPEENFIDAAIAANFSGANEGFMKILADIFGGREYVQMNVATNLGHCLDFVVSFDKFGAPLALPCKVLTFDEIPKSQVNSVAVLFNTRSHYPLNYPEKLRGIFDLRTRTIEALGIKVCNISTLMYNNLPEEEKLSYLEREIRFAAQ